MADLHKTPSIELEVKDFGPIVHGKVDLRPMTVFIGPSNTGKSYLAILLYALHRFFSTGGDWRWGFGRFVSGVSDLPAETVTALKELIDAVPKASAGRNDDAIALPAPITELLHSQFNSLGDALTYEIMRCFGVDESAVLVRKSRGAYTSVMISRGGAYCATPLQHTLKFDGRGADLQTTVPEHVSVESITRLSQIADAYRPYNYADAYIPLMYMMPSIMMGNLHLPAYYLPADRTGVMHAHSAVVSAMIGNAPLAGLQYSERTPMLSGVLADFLRQLIEMDMIPRWRPLDRQEQAQQNATSREMESTMLNGTVRIDRSEFINYPHFTYRPSGWKNTLPLMNASSMVSEIAPVVLYLRHIVQPGNVLIIEEPESHLHPAMQVEFTRQLAKLVQHGYRVIITTHSEWVLEELSNVIKRSQLPEKERAAVSESDAALLPEQVGVWLFRPKRRPRGSEVIEVGLDESGLYPSGYDDVAVALHNDWANITDRAAGANQ